jgi:predicted alpha/beta-hydrolase family hydrolase
VDGPGAGGAGAATLRDVEIMTGEGPARVDVAWPGAATADAGRKGSGAARRSPAGRRAGGPAFLLALTHGAGGGVDAPDLLAVREVALRLGGVVASVTQPYGVKGSRAPGSVARQDAAWVEIITALRDVAGPGIRLIQGGRSNGARVACRTARTVGARAVIALAFPLHPPGRPDRSRAGELAAAGTDVLVVNGRRDPFGIPDQAATTQVVVLEGETHALSRKPEAVGRAVESWLRGRLS